MAHQCSHPRCTADAVAQWARIGTPDEAAGRVVQTQERAHLNDELRRFRQRAVIRELEAVREDPEFDPNLIRVLEAQIQREQDVLSAITDTVPYADPNPTTVAVFACSDHVITRAEAARLHEAECMSAGPCACVTGEPQGVELSLTISAPDPFRD